MKNNPYDNYLSTHFGSLHDPTDHSFSQRYFDRNFFPYLPKNKQITILDIGCGTGDFLYYVQQLGYQNAVGIDISKEQVAYCKEHITKHVYLTPHLRNYLKKHKQTYDFILMNDVIEHLPKDEIVDTLSQVYAALRYNGKVLIKTANIKHRWGMAVRYMDFTHTIGFAEESMRQVLLLSGFTDILLVAEVHPVHDIKSFLRIILKSFFELRYRLEYLASFGVLQGILTNMFIAIGTRTKK